MVLAELGFGVEPDGDFGKATHQAVIAAQRSMGLTADGVVGPKTWEGLDEAFQPGVDNFTSSGVLNPQQVAAAEAQVPHPASLGGHPRLAGVHPILIGKAMAMIRLAADDGYTIRVTQGLRTFAEQDALYAQGRTRPGPRVSNAPAGASAHNYGAAVDVAFLVSGKLSWDVALYKNLGPWIKRVGGLEWGGDWSKFKDYPHIQLAGLPPTKVMLAAYRAAGGGKRGIEAVWARFL